MQETISGLPAHAAELIRKAESEGWRMAYASDSGVFLVRGDRRPILKDMMGLAFLAFSWASLIQGFIHTETSRGVFLAALVLVTAGGLFSMANAVRRYSRPSSVESRFLSAAELADPNCPPVF